jgi:hypothetical protein
MPISHEALKSLGLNKTDLRDPYLRKLQAMYDRDYFDENPYALEMKQFANGSKHVSHADAKTDHIAKHVANTTAKLWFTPDTSAIVSEILPDILIHRTQLANTLRFDLGKHVEPTTTAEDSLEAAVNELMIAERELFGFCQPLEHGLISSKQRDRVRKLSIPALHMAGLILANQFELEPKALHVARLNHFLMQRHVVIPQPGK